jgi:phenylalanyl-tRNA synthetase alpha chain
MEENKPPIRTISQEEFFRNEAVSSRSHCIFHQVEGLYIDKDVSFADLKQTLISLKKDVWKNPFASLLFPIYGTKC